MSLLEQQVIELRRQFQLLKNSQVSITDTEPREPSKQSIWREGATLKTWDGRNWIDTSGGVLDFTTSVVFSSSAYNSVSWSSGNVNIGTSTGVATYAIGSGSFTMTGNTFFYWAPDTPTAIQTTTTPATAIMSGGVLLAVGQVNSDPTATKASIKTFGNSQNDLITADQIVANSITSNKLATALIYAGSITLSSGGVVRSGKTTYADSNTGFWLGSDSGTPKFKIGTSSEYMDWSGSAFTIVGGTITGSWVRTAVSGDRIDMIGSSLRAYDSAGNLRTRITSGGINLYGVNFGEIGSIYENTTGMIFSNDSAVFEFAGEIKITGSSGGFYAESGRPKWKLGADKGSIPYRDTTGILTFGGTANRQIPMMVDGTLYYFQAAV